MGKKAKESRKECFITNFSLMTKISLDQIKKLRAKTKAGVMDCRQALEESNSDMGKAEKWLREKGLKSAAKREDRATCQGLIETYSHSDGKIVAVVELLCETDFVARTKDFKDLALKIKEKVKEVFNIELAEEVEFIGDFDASPRNIFSKIFGKR